MTKRLAAVFMALLALPAAAAPLDVKGLFERLARERPERAQFHERKYLALLDKPVDSSGELVFTPPGRLEKRTVSPKPESVVVDRDTVTLERGGRRRTLDLSANPSLAVLVESIRATLAGDLAGLTRTYSVALDGDTQRWRLVLRPLDPSLGTLVERVEISGSGARVQSVSIFQPDGDRSVMTLTPR
jgi:hypothetical protein